MKKILKNSMISLFLLLLISCSTTVPVSGSGNISSTKVGTAKQTTVFGIINLGEEATIENAARNGNITTVTTVHYKTTTFPLLSVECIVRGNWFNNSFKLFPKIRQNPIYQWGFVFLLTYSEFFLTIKPELY